jgi:hypothetical protein
MLWDQPGGSALAWVIAMILAAALTRSLTDLGKIVLEIDVRYCLCREWDVWPDRPLSMEPSKEAFDAAWACVLERIEAKKAALPGN